MKFHFHMELLQILKSTLSVERFLASKTFKITGSSIYFVEYRLNGRGPTQFPNHTINRQFRHFIDHAIWKAL